MRITEPENMSSTPYIEDGNTAENSHYIIARKEPDTDLYRFHRVIDGTEQKTPMTKKGIKVQLSFKQAVQALYGASNGPYMAKAMDRHLTAVKIRPDHVSNFVEIPPAKTDLIL